jgi:adenylate cyclase
MHGLTMASVCASSSGLMKVVSHFCASLMAAGVPLWRVNIGQHFPNPLLVAWGEVWTPDHTESYDITHESMLTDGYVGSTFEYILEKRRRQNGLTSIVRLHSPRRRHSPILPR